MRDVAHKDFTNRDKREVDYCQIDVQMSENYHITNKIFPRLLRKFIIMRLRDPFSETMCPRLARDRKTLFLVKG